MTDAEYTRWRITRQPLSKAELTVFYFMYGRKAWTLHGQEGRVP